MEKLYTVEDVAQMTGLTSRTIRNYLADGRLTGRKVGAQWRFTEENIAAIFTEAGNRSSRSSAAADVEAFLKPQNRLTITVCSVIDYPAESAEAVAALVSRLTEQQLGFGDPTLKFHFDFDQTNSVARFTIIGEIAMVAKMTKTIRKDGLA